MNDSNNLIYKQATRLQIGVCGLLFSIFSFVYLYAFQAGVIEALHYSLSKGRTHYEPLVGAIIITFVLLLFRWGINKLLGLKGPVRALAYFPSCLLLGVLTDVDRTAFHGGNFADYWQWLLPLSLMVYAIVAFGLRRLMRRQLNQSVTPGFMLNSNLLILLACCLMTIGLGNTDILFHHELDVEHSLRHGQYAEALGVGEKSLETTHTLNALRAYAMAREGSLPQHLFDYPQPYGAEGLLFPVRHSECLRTNNDSLVVYLGGRRRQGEQATDYLGRLFNAKDGSHTVFDYYLCSLLLDKQLQRFVQTADQNLFADDPLPRHYAEAIALYRHLHPAYKGLEPDEQTLQRWADYQAESRLYTQPEERKNRLRLTYGDTYWWYYDYQMLP